MIDLHTHSSASDGTLSPAQLVENALQQGLSALALTDHDTIAGLDEAKQEAEKSALRFIPGIEIEITWEPGEFHLLGLGIYQPRAAFLEALAELAHLREMRNRKIIQRMQEWSIPVTYEDILSLFRSSGKSIGRPHFASLLIKLGVVKNQEQAFSQYLGRGRPFYVPKEGMEFRRAVQVIQDAGGIAVLAHPMSLYVAWGHLPALVKALKEQGLNGIEAWHPTAKVRSCKRLEELGKSLGLCITAGSDFHGETRPERKLGITAGNIKIDDAILAAIPALEGLRSRAITPKSLAS
ncbi:MAG: PHP domain-containing protein [Treponema sp.]|jgi:predicted metal-dependent phosphoesterase TrpH|nr:PHP domain-containing protein [Treponema sp.]